MMAVCVDPKKINKVWPHFRERIKRACDKVGLISVEDIERDFPDALLWLAYDGVIVHAAATTRLAGGVCEITACCGDNLQGFLPLLKDLEQYARNENCKYMQIIGRKGWMRVLEDYKFKAVTLRKEL